MLVARRTGRARAPETGRMSQQTTARPLTAIPTQRRRRGRAAEPAAPLGSLTQREHRVDAGCTACGSLQVTHLKMVLTDGTPVRFTSCHRCEHRAWAHVEGGTLSVESVLDRARKLA